jgi:hypothetical protein
MNSKVTEQQRTQNTHKPDTNAPPAETEPVIPPSGRPQNHVSVYEATEFDLLTFPLYKIT